MLMKNNLIHQYTSFGEKKKLKSELLKTDFNCEDLYALILTNIRGKAV